MPAPVKAIRLGEQEEGNEYREGKRREIERERDIYIYRENMKNKKVVESKSKLEK